VQVCYYLRLESGATFSFEELMLARERLRALKIRGGTIVEVGGWTLSIRPYGSSSGFPLVLDHADFTIECGEFNQPSFYVTLRSAALWRQGALSLHEMFLAWAGSVGLVPDRPEKLSRADFAFDYWLSAVDFTPDNVVSLSSKDSQHREDGAVQTITYGKSDVVLRLYNKVVEIEQQSQKVWLFDLWGVKENVWRIEWQVRKDVLRRFSLRTFEDLFDGQGDVLRYLATEHDSLRVPVADTNRSRWPLHPLWKDLVQQIESFSAQGVYREVDPQAVLRERLQGVAVAVYGYQKRAAAILALLRDQPEVGLGDCQQQLSKLIGRLHDPLSWGFDVKIRREEMMTGRHG
jgi:hypothetical protein